MTDTATPTYDLATARKLASDIAQMLIANQALGVAMILDVMVNLAVGIAFDAGISAAELCEAITTTHDAISKRAAEQLLARTTTADSDKGKPT